MFDLITLIEGNSVADEIVKEAKDLIRPGEKVLVILDSNHTKEHVLAELESYHDIVSPGSYIVVTDGIMKDLEGAPRSDDDWAENNPFTAAKTFLEQHDEFVEEIPEFIFDESTGLTNGKVTYWPGAWLKKKPTI